MAYTDRDRLIADYIPEAKSDAEKTAIGRILDGVCAFADTYCRRSSGYFAAKGATLGALQKVRVGVDANITAPGRVSLQLTAAGMSGSPRTVNYEASGLDDGLLIAAGLRGAAAADPIINAFFSISGAGAGIDLEVKAHAPNDSTLAATVFAPFFGGAVTVTQTYSSSLVAGTYDPPTEKRVCGEGEHFLRLPVHVPGTIEQVSLHGGVIDSAHYYESEKNGWLYYDGDTYDRSDYWIDGALYTVKARWGFAATPLDLEEAIRQTVARIWQAQKGVLGEVTPNGFVIERAMPLFAREVLDRYKRREFEV